MRKWDHGASVACCGGDLRDRAAESGFFNAWCTTRGMGCRSCY